VILNRNAPVNLLALEYIYHLIASEMMEKPRRYIKKIIIYGFAGIAILMTVYMLGPVPLTPVIDPVLPPVERNLAILEAEVDSSEKEIRGLKPDNQARIIWADPDKRQRTEYSLVYLHGFSGSQGDGFPVHLNFARRYGCNLYLSRLYGHGIDSKDPLLDLTPDNLLQSAKEAVSIGKTLGEKVILMGTSTGGTLALIIAGSDPEIAGLILYSPNIDLSNSRSSLLIKPWGLYLGRLIAGSKYYRTHDPDSIKHYWYAEYRIEALVSLKSLLSSTMNRKTFSNVHQPLFAGYFYKNKKEQDDQVSISRIFEMFDQVSTAPYLKRKVSFPNAGAHAIASSWVSKDIQSVESETFRFAEEVLKMAPKDRSCK
jgi:pimeloyl-ACP methyl ester carboxylesterase